MTVVIGLTGGIASGKSTVSSILEKEGIPVIDADQIAREVVEVGKPAYKQIVETFGGSILLGNLQIDRPALGTIIFNDSQQRERLNKIVHPAVRQEMLKQKEDLMKYGHSAVVMDIPLLFESELTHLVDKVLVVYVDVEVQLERLMKRNRLSMNEAKARISSQMPLTKKVELADAVINNNGSVEETKQQLIHILNEWKIR